MSTGQLAELKSEAEIYLSLDHPHIARLENVYETSAQMHLVMEHMAGGELFDRLRTQHRFAEEDAAGAGGILSTPPLRARGAGRSTPFDQPTHQSRIRGGSYGSAMHSRPSDGHPLVFF